jgi:ribosomal protein S27E
MPDEPILREKARHALRSGKMPSRKPDRTYGGPGSRVTCALCSELITSDQSEIEIEFRRHNVPPQFDRYFLHVRCMAAWEFERTKVSA